MFQLCSWRQKQVVYTDTWSSLDPKQAFLCNRSMNKALQQDEIEKCCNIKRCKVVNVQKPTLPTVILAHLSVSAEFVFAQITRCSEMTACAISFVFFYWRPPTWENRMWKITSTHAWINLFYICTMYRSEPQFVGGLHSSDQTVQLITCFYFNLNIKEK